MKLTSGKNRRWKRSLLQWAVLWCFIMVTLTGGQLLHQTLVSAASDNVLLLGGSQTRIGSRTKNAFGEPIPALSEKQLEEFEAGDEHFGAAFISKVTDDVSLGGVGPRFDNPSCEGCHFADGKGRPVIGLSRSELVIRPSVVSSKESIPLPEIGNQLEPHALYGSNPEATVEISWIPVKGTYADGTPYELRKPQARLTLPNQKPLPPNTVLTLRSAPSTVGTGSLDALDPETLLALADPEDKNQDGISGRPNWVENLETGEKAVGKFGRKANAPTLYQQVAEAYFNDMGVSNPLLPDPDGHMDIDAKTLDQTVFYMAGLALTTADPKILKDPVLQRGETLFGQSCVGCHVTTLKTGNYPTIPALAQQTIHPYSDLLLHDMGSELADGRPDGVATGQEWRTTPLWNLGIADQVNPYAGYLHDGRARTIAEAILWHGGEGQKAKETFEQLPASDREALVQFVSAL